MREDIPHPDKRTSLRVVLESSPVYSRRFSRNLKRDSLRSPSSLPGASRDGLGLTVVSLPCPKGYIFWCGSWGRENTNHSQGGGSWQRITASSVVVFEGGASPPSTPFLMPTHQETRRAKKNPPPTSQKVDIFIPSWYTVYAEGRQGFSIDLWGLLYHFSLLRGLRVLYFPYLRVLWISPLMCSPIINSPCRLQHHLSKDNVTEGWHPPPSVI